MTRNWARQSRSTVSQGSLRSFSKLVERLGYVSYPSIDAWLLHVGMRIRSLYPHLWLPTHHHASRTPYLHSLYRCQIKNVSLSPLTSLLLFLPSFFFFISPSYVLIAEIAERGKAINRDKRRSQVKKKLSKSEQKIKLLEENQVWVFIEVQIKIYPTFCIDFGARGWFWSEPSIDLRFQNILS